MSSLPKEFWEMLPRRTEEELCEMLIRPNEYQPEAVVAAREEWSRRCLPPDRIAQAEANVESQRAQLEAIAGARMTWGMRLLVFIFVPFALLPVPILIYYYGKGYKRKVSDWWVTAAASLGFYVLLGIIVSVLLPAIL